MKGIFQHIMIVCCTLPVLVGCVKPFDPDIRNFESVYVVDGELNNLEGPYQVKVSKSFAYADQNPVEVTGATVIIEDDSGNSVSLTESSDGLYTTEGSSFQGEAGRSYKLRIRISDDVVLESDFEQLKEPVEIKDIYWEYQDRRSYAGVTGLEIYLDSRPADNNAFYYAWEYEEYWKFTVPYTTPYYPDNKTCWDSSMQHSLILATTTGYQEDAIKRKSLYFINNQSNRLSIRYSTLVKQYVLTEQAYLYYKNLKELNENSGSLFDPIPYSLEGNMHYVDHPEIPVLGLFQVSGVTEKRIFIDSGELPGELVAYSGFESCRSTQILENEEELLDSIALLNYVAYDTVDTPMDTVRTISFASSDDCFLCTENGTNQEPDFWEE